MRAGAEVDLVPMDGIDYFDAWHQWFDGKEVKLFDMWGMSILWWARLGKVLQFMAGLTVILDLIGAGRLRTIGTRLGGLGLLYACRQAARAYFRLRHVHRIQRLLRVARIYPTIKQIRLAAEERIQVGGGEQYQARRLAVQLDMREYAQRRLWVSSKRQVKRAKRMKYMDPVIVLITVGVMVMTLDVRPLALVRNPSWSLAVAMGSIIAVAVVMLAWVRASTLTTYSWAFVCTVWALLIAGLTRLALVFVGSKLTGAPIRGIALCVFLLGFHFDLLGS